MAQDDCILGIPVLSLFRSAWTIFAAIKGAGIFRIALTIWKKSIPQAFSENSIYVREPITALS